MAHYISLLSEGG